MNTRAAVVGIVLVLQGLSACGDDSSDNEAYRADAASVPAEPPGVDAALVPDAASSTDAWPALDATPSDSASAFDAPVDASLGDAEQGRRCDGGTDYTGDFCNGLDDDCDGLVDNVDDITGNHYEITCPGIEQRIVVGCTRPVPPTGCTVLLRSS